MDEAEPGTPQARTELGLEAPKRIRVAWQRLMVELRD